MTPIGNKERIPWIFCFWKWKFQQINGVTLSQMWQSGHCHTMSEKTQMTDDEKIWRLIRIRIRQFIHKKTKWDRVGLFTRDQYCTWSRRALPSTTPPPPSVAILYIYRRIGNKNTIRKMRLYKFIRIAYSHPLLITEWGNRNAFPFSWYGNRNTCMLPQQFIFVSIYIVRESGNRNVFLFSLLESLSVMWWSIVVNSANSYPAKMGFSRRLRWRQSQEDERRRRRHDNQPANERQPWRWRRRRWRQWRRKMPRRRHHGTWWTPT